MIKIGTVKFWKLLTFLSFFLSAKVVNAQFNGLYFAYSDNSISKKEIRKNVREIFTFIDSVKSVNQIDVAVKFHMCIYFNDLSDTSKRWSNLQNYFYKKIEEVVGKENMFIHPSSNIDSNFITKVDHLSIGPVFYSNTSD